MICNPLYTLGGGGGVSCDIKQHATLAGVFATASPTDGDRASVVNGTSVIGVWRYSVALGSVWVPDGWLDLGAVGSDTPLGAGVDGWPSSNTPSGSTAYSWDSLGLLVTGAGSDVANEGASWEWPLVGGVQQITETFANAPEVGDTLNVTINGTLTAYVAVSTTLNDEVTALRAAMTTALAAEPVTVGGTSAVVTITADVGGVAFTYSSSITLTAAGPLTVTETVTGGDIDWGDVRTLYMAQNLVFTGSTVAFGGPYVGNFGDNDAGNARFMGWRYEFNDNDTQVFCQGSNIAGSSTGGLNVMIEGMYSQADTADSGISGTMYVAEAAAAPSILTLATTNAAANHQAGDRFSRFGLAHIGPSSIDAAWTCAFRKTFITIAEK